MTTTTRLPLHSIVLLAVILIVTTFQIPYLLTLDTSSNSDFFALPSNLTLKSVGLLHGGFGLQPLQALSLQALPPSGQSDTSHIISDSESREPHTRLATKADAIQHLEPHCYDAPDRSYCCAVSWEHDLDEWWQEHPDWEPSLENDTSYCFSPIQDPDRAQLLRDKVYPLQWQKHPDQDSCFNQTYAHMMINSGYSANLGLLGRSFLTAVLNNKAFVPSKKKVDFLWRYANRNGTGVCPSADMDCYFLPISSCKAELGQHQGFDRPLVDKNGGNYGKSITFLRNYMVRPKHWLRRRVYELLQGVKVPAQPCTVIHVRRTDVVLENNWRKKRHYFTIADYLKEVDDSNVLLLTDDQTAIEEALEFHGTEKNWTFLERKRWRGTEGGMNGHLPSGDPTLEVAYILAEQRLASQCRKLVFTRSGFADVLLQAMQIREWDIEKKRIDFGRQPNATYAVSADEFFEQQQSQRNATLRTAMQRRYQL